jgi:type II secretory pathway pseudopilin PulG
LRNFSNPVPVRHRWPFPPRSRGFSLVVSLFLMVVMTLIATGLLSLSSIALRSASRVSDQETAKANARLALMIAIGELQTTLGPDQRVSAPSAILESGSKPVANPHWVGVWSTRKKDGSSFWTRDDRRGGLQDLRISEKWDREQEALSFLVSGNEGGRGLGRDLVEPFEDGSKQATWVELVGAGTLGAAASLDRGRVSVPKVELSEGGRPSGSYGYWVGDLGVRANVAVQDDWKGRAGSASAVYPMMASQQASPRIMNAGSGDGWEDGKVERGKLASTSQLDLAVGKEWKEGLWQDVTTWSQGVIADVREGGLKKNLTIYLDSGSGSSSGPGGSIADTDRLVGPRNADHAVLLGHDWSGSRYKNTAPTFAMLKDLVRQSPELDANLASVRWPQSTSQTVELAAGRSASANNVPTLLKGKSTSDLQPILVEASAFSLYSTFRNPPGSLRAYSLRKHFWPRVVLWNPYNIPLELPPSVVMIQINGRSTLRVQARSLTGSQGTLIVQFLEGGRAARQIPPGTAFKDSELFRDPYAGMWYFSLPAETIEPGGCYVYSTASAQAYSSSNVLTNRLSSSAVPDPSKNLHINYSTYVSATNTFEGGSDFLYQSYTLNLDSAEKNQVDDSRTIWKSAKDVSSLAVAGFDALPQIQAVSCSPQFGAGREPNVVWSVNNPVPIPYYGTTDYTITALPDNRSREGYRLRWFDEPVSNLLGASKTTGEAAFDEALLANWNPRAAYSIRSPWENLAGDPGDGLASGPWFYGAYTKDLYDSEVGWAAQMPRFSNGKARGNPFGPPQEGRDRMILFEVPRSETGVVSLAQFQHAKLTDHVWHPSYAIGNSLADPRLGIDGLTGTAPNLGSESKGGWNAPAIGWASDADRSANPDEWAKFGRFILQDLPENDSVVYDLSYEVNHSLWDEFFLSGGSKARLSDVAEDGGPLPNGRLKLRVGASPDDLADLKRSARTLMLDGAFNVNSTSVEAWKALLASTSGSKLGTSGGIPVPRSPLSKGEAWEAGSGSADDDSAWDGFRSLSEVEIAALAREIVSEVKLRGPFLSLSDFVNRRLVNDHATNRTGVKGTLQAAIDRANLNAAFDQAYRLENGRPLGDYQHPDNIRDATRVDQRLKPASKAWGAPGYLTQADLLQVLGPALSARSDSFVIRTYGEAKNASGEITARAWCEAVVQRTPDPIAPDSEGLDPDRSRPEGAFGRSFRVISFRWLAGAEV